VLHAGPLQVLDKNSHCEAENRVLENSTRANQAAVTIRDEVFLDELVQRV